MYPQFWVRVLLQTSILRFCNFIVSHLIFMIVIARSVHASLSHLLALIASPRQCLELEIAAKDLWKFFSQIAEYTSGTVGEQIQTTDFRICLASRARHALH